MNPTIVIVPHEPSATRRGCADGYIAVRSDHPWYGKSAAFVQSEMLRLKHKSVHGGIVKVGSISSGYLFLKSINLFGFTTDHPNDGPDNWHMDRVYNETLHLWRAARRAWVEQPSKINIKNEDPIPQPTP